MKLTKTKATTFRKTERFLRISGGTITACNGYIFATAPFPEGGDMYVCPEADRFLSAMSMCGDKPIKYTLTAQGNLKVESKGFTSTIPCLAAKDTFPVVTFGANASHKLKEGAWEKIKEAMKTGMSFIGLGADPSQGENVTFNFMRLEEPYLDAVSPYVSAQCYVGKVGMPTMCIPNGIVDLLLHIKNLELEAVGINDSFLHRYEFSDNHTLLVQSRDPSEFADTNSAFYAEFNPKAMVKVTAELVDAVRAIGPFADGDVSKDIILSEGHVTTGDESTVLDCDSMVTGRYDQRFLSVVFNYAKYIEKEPVSINKSKALGTRWMNGPVRGIIAPISLQEDV